MKALLPLTIVVFTTTIAIQMPLASGATPLEQIRTAVAAEPDRPGLRVALAAHLVVAGELDEAEILAKAIIARWPQSTRAKALLSAIHRLRQEKATQDSALHAAEKIKGDSTTSTGPQLTWKLTGSAGLYHDSVVAWDTTTLETQAIPRDAWRSQVSADARANYVKGPWRYQGLLGLDRTLHLDSQSLITDRDRSLLSLRGQAEQTTPSQHRLGLRADLKGALGGRPGDLHHFAGGLGGWWSRGAKYFSPFIEARAWYFQFAPNANTNILNRVLRLGEGAIGVASHLHRFRLSARANALWLEPNKKSGYTEVGGDISVDFIYQPIVLRVRGGLGHRTPGDSTQSASLRPRATVQLRTRWSQHVFVLLESHWRRATGIADYLPGNHLDRWVSGIQLEVVQ